MPAQQKPLTITLLGCGKMGSALLKNWLNLGLIESVNIIEPNDIDISFLETNNNIKHYKNINKPINSEILVLAVKPQIMKQATQQITKAGISTNTIVLSIAAGQNLNMLATLFPANQPIIRAMPNTPAAIGKGVTASVTNAHVTQKQKEISTQLLQATGISIWLKDEALMDSVTALSGSGPAYLFYFIEALTKSGETLGLDKETSLTLARQTIIGSAALAEHNHKETVENLRKSVTSPNGTTEAALKTLMDGRFQSLLDEALKAAQKRSKDLNTKD